MQTAGFDDVQAIARLISLTWPYENPSMPQIMRALKNPRQVTLVVRPPQGQKSQIAGFVSCFPVRLSKKSWRWQIDLLAVHPGYRRQGIGRQLIKAAVQTDQAQKAMFCQALIETDNHASQRAFAAAGFQPTGPVCQLMMLKSDQLPPFCRDFRPLLVETLTYQGLWLEPGPWHEPAIIPPIVSTLIPLNPKTRFEEARAAGFNSVGSYQNWKFVVYDQPNSPLLT